MSAFQLRAASPEGIFYEGPAEMLTLRGDLGDLAVMPGHVPFMTGVKPCVISVHLEDGRVLRAAVKGGLLTVGKDGSSLLCPGFEKAYGPEDGN